MAIYNGPARGGTRGGKDQFSWDKAKEDKYLQNHLGHSLMAPLGRWQNGKDLTWYNKGSKTVPNLKQAEQNELKYMKEREKDLMAQMLGEKRMENPQSALKREEKIKLFKKGDAEEGTVADGIASESFGERIQGLGYAPIKVDDLREHMEVTTSEKIEGTGINELLAAHARGDQHDDSQHDDTGPHHDHAAMLAAIMAHGGGGGNEDGDADESDRKARKAEKKMKKLMKQEKKAKKEAKKDAKKNSKKRDSSSSPEPSRSERQSASSFFRKDSSNSEAHAWDRKWDKGKERVDDREYGSSTASGGRGRDRRSRSRSRERDARRSRSREREQKRGASREREGRGQDEERRRRRDDSEEGRGGYRSRSRERERRGRDRD